MDSLDQLPGFRRRFRVIPGEGFVRSEVEDDYHCMTVVIRHEGGVVTEVEAKIHRAPWTTCPGAQQQLVDTFTGKALEAFPRAAGEKTSNCTHLFDLALLAAAHAQDAQELVYDVLVSDPVDGERQVELRRDGEVLLQWTERNGKFVAPEDLAGEDLMSMGRWIAGLDEGLQEGARILRWGGMLAHGRTLPLEQQSDAKRMPPNCYTFQPERAAVAVRVGEIKDFSKGGEEPLEETRKTL